MLDPVQKVGIAELKEVIAALDLLLGAYKEVMQDGKVDLKDLPVLVRIGTQAEILVKAVEGVQGVPAEVKDIDQLEAVELVKALYDLVAKAKA